MKNNINLYNADVLSLYDKWEAPIVIISDGPYGISGFDGDTKDPKELKEWYRPHILKWTEKSTPLTTLWFWNTEIGWANIHPLIENFGWKYVNCHIWNKGKAHIAGNANSKTLRKFPVVTELCAQYVKEAYFNVGENVLSMKDWLRYEWQRSCLPLSKANEACEVKNAATRKYLTKCHLWYFPPSEAFDKLVKYANTYGDKNGKPYFSIDGRKSLTGTDWEKFRSKFYCEYGVTNVWDVPPLNGNERIKIKSKSVHLNQKPLEIMRLLIKASSDIGDVIWEPFGGLFSASLTAAELKRKIYASEIKKEFYEIGLRRFDDFK